MIGNPSYCIADYIAAADGWMYDYPPGSGVKANSDAGDAGEYRYWKLGLVVFGALGLATCVVRRPGFWNSYVLDIVAPAWNYILVRGLFSRTKPAMLSRLLGPELAFLTIGSVCVSIETAQYLNLYEAHYDPFDFVAYFSLLVPCYAVDRWCVYRRTNHAGIDKR